MNARLKRRLLVGVAVAVVVIAALIAFVPRHAAAPPVAGMVRQTEIRIAPEITGRVASIEVRAGQAVRKVLERIAKEGRKYGVSLGLITQRPSDLAEGVLSQCGTIIAMRLNNDRDQAFVKSAMPEGSRGFLDVIPALRNRECIVCGEGVSIPIRVSFDDLERDRAIARDEAVIVERMHEVSGHA